MKSVCYTLLLWLFASWAWSAEDVEGVKAHIQARVAEWQQLHSGFPLPAATIKLYESHRFKPFWLNAESRQQLVLALQDLELDGLQPDDYQVDALQASLQNAAFADETDIKTLADFDLNITAHWLSALSQLRWGKLDAESMKPCSLAAQDQALLGIDVEFLQRALDQHQIADTFAHQRLQHPLYVAMRNEMARLLEWKARGGWQAIPSGKTLRPGMEDERVPLLRVRVQQERISSSQMVETPETQSALFDDALVEQVKQFQTQHFLLPDGLVGRQTLSSLNESLQQHINQLRVNMERLRWALPDWNGHFVLVDIAGYTLTYFRHGEQILTSKVQVGQPFRSTPVIKSAITYITLNPTWTVPPTILKEDVIPALQKNKDYLASRNIRVLDADGNELVVDSVDWSVPDRLILRQDAGPRNALGRVVIRFPNSYSVYLHETPYTELFGKPRRAFSSGCIRVERALDLAKLLLEETPDWEAAAIDAQLASGQTRNVHLKNPVPILLFYFTVEATESGIVYRPDIYERDSAVLQGLSLRQG